MQIASNNRFRSSSITHFRHQILASSLLLLCATLTVGQQPPVTTATQLVSIHFSGSNSGNGASTKGRMSADGRFVVFESSASNLVAGDNNSLSDVFRRDMQTGVTLLVSVSQDGTSSGNGASARPVISADGRYVAFESQANDLVSNTSNNLCSSTNVFVRDMDMGITTLVSVNINGVTSGGSGCSFTPSAENPVISANGRYVAFEALADDLVPDDNNGFRDIFVRDLQTNITALVSRSIQGTTNAMGQLINSGNDNSFSPQISADGRYVSFESLARNLVVSDTNNQRDVFWRDMQAATPQLVSINFAGNNGGNSSSTGAQISADGRFVVFQSSATDIVIIGAGFILNPLDVYRRDMQVGITALVSVSQDGNSRGNGASAKPTVSVDGRYVAFESQATNLVSNDPHPGLDIFVRDLDIGITTLVSANPQGVSTQINSLIIISTNPLIVITVPVSNAQNAVISADGRYVAFEAVASNLVPNDNNFNQDILVRDVQAGTTALVSKNLQEFTDLFGNIHATGNRASSFPQVSADGRYISFESLASDLVDVDTNNLRDVFRRDMQAAQIDPPQISKSFDPVSVPVGGAATLSFTVVNPNQNNALNNITFSDPLPEGLIVATPNGLTNSCGGTVNAISGGNEISVSIGTMPANTTCTIDIQVVATTPGVKNNVAGPITSSDGGTGNQATATLTVIAPPTFSKSFGAATISIGGLTSLSFTIINPNQSADLNGVGFSDTLPAGLIIASPNGQTGSCDDGIITATAGSSTIALTNATLPANSSCTFSVNIVSVTGGIKNNLTSSVTSTNGGSGDPATATLTVIAPPSLSKNFGAAAISVGAITSLGFTITNSNQSIDLTGISFSDSLPAGLVVATPNGATNSCGGAVTADPGSNIISVSIAAVPANTVCNVSVQVLAVAPGVKTNITSAVTSLNGGTGNQATATLTVNNPSPVVTITGPPTGSIYSVGTSVSFTGTFTDNPGGTHTATWSFGALAQPGIVNELTGDVSASYTFTQAGVYLVTLTVADEFGAIGTANTIGGLTALIIIYDSGIGQVTGGGWIDSPAGAYMPNPILTGKANFGFVSKYKSGVNLPTGNTEFQFKVGNINFRSTSYDWLLVVGAKAQFRGSGTINGTGDYTFVLTAVDGKLDSSGGADKFRIKIWNKSSGAVIYDNQLGAADDVAPTTTLGGGSIVIHK